MEPIKIEINGVIDLHTFHPRDAKNVVIDYLEACLEKGIYQVRIIHGKGQGILRERVRKHLENHSLVRSSRTAPPEAGGWGATLVELVHRLPKR